MDGGPSEFVISGSGDSLVKLWDLKSCKEVASMYGHSAEVVSMHKKFSAQNRDNSGNMILHGLYTQNKN